MFRRFSYLDKQPCCESRQNEGTEREAPSPGLGICILGLPETAGVHFLVRLHHYILNLETAVHGQIRRWKRLLRYIREKWYFWMDNQRGIYIFSQPFGNKMAHAGGRKCSSE